MHVRNLGAPRSAGRGAVLAAGLVLAALVLTAPSPAAAQPGAPPPPPPPPPGGAYGPYRPPYARPYYYVPPPPDPTRRGLTLGFGVGLGAMSSDSNLTECINCNYDPIAVAFDFHIGGMITPRLALLGELFWTAQTIDAAGFNWLNQTMVVGALQLWLTPQLWLKGGVGFASISSHYDDGFLYADSTIDSGVAVLAAAGYEILHSPWFAVDLQGRLASGNYDGVNDQVNVATIGLGFNWY